MTNRLIAVVLLNGLLMSVCAVLWRSHKRPFLGRALDGLLWLVGIPSFVLVSSDLVATMQHFDVFLKEHDHSLAGFLWWWSDLGDWDAAAVVASGAFWTAVLLVRLVISDISCLGEPTTEPTRAERATVALGLGLAVLFLLAQVHAKAVFHEPANQGHLESKIGALGLAKGMSRVGPTAWRQALGPLEGLLLLHVSCGVFATIFTWSWQPSRARGGLLLLLSVAGWSGWRGCASLYLLIAEGFSREWLMEGDGALAAWFVWNCVATAVGLWSLRRANG